MGRIQRTKYKSHTRPRTRPSDNRKVTPTKVADALLLFFTRPWLTDQAIADRVGCCLERLKAMRFWTVREFIKDLPAEIRDRGFARLGLQPKFSQQSDVVTEVSDEEKEEQDTAECKFWDQDDPGRVATPLPAGRFKRRPGSTKQAAVLFLSVYRPEWTDGQIAAAAQCNRTSMHRMKFWWLRDYLKPQLSDRPRGDAVRSRNSAVGVGSRQNVDFYMKTEFDVTRE